MKLPDTLAVMALPNAILFPQAVMPLYIFEPRYRQMLRDAVESHRMFAVGLMREIPQPDQPEPEPHDVFCAGLIRAAVGLHDGTSNVLVQGLARVRVTKWLNGKPYRLAEIEELASTHTDEVTTDALAAKIAELAELRGTRGQPLPSSLLTALAKLDNAEILGDLVGFLLLTDFQRKQQLLETLDLRLRLRKLIRLLQTEIDQLRAQPQAPE